MAAKEKGKKIYHLNIGQPDLPTPEAYYNAVNSYRAKTLEYEASPGMPLMIDAVRKYYKELDVDLAPEDVFITTGGSEALLFTCLSIMDPYTEVIIPEPYYPNYTTFVHAAGGVIRALPTNPWEGYRYAKRERIESLITKNTRAIMITNPGNPTGVVLSQEEMRMIADIAKERGLFLICDEVYREFCYDEEAGIPTMAHFRDIDENLVIIDSVSKRFSACGARVGCVVTRNQELQQALGVPIGLVDASFGGTYIEGWMKKEVIEADSKIMRDCTKIKHKVWKGKESHLYNANIYPIRYNSFAGVIWYQGCANVSSSPRGYAHALEVLVNSWREEFRNPTMPF